MDIKHVNLQLPIFINRFGKDTKLNDYLMNTINEYRNSFPQSNTSNVFAWHSNYYTHLHDEFDWSPIIRLVLDTCYTISNKHFNVDTTGGDYQYIVNNMWIAQYEKNDYTRSHYHFPSVFSACYYVEVEDKCSPIVFGKRGELKIQPESGMLLVWLGMIPHSVPETNTKRTCICMNTSMQVNESLRKIHKDSIQSTQQSAH